jgi:hypothetical protein
MEIDMQSGEIAFLMFVMGAISLFGGVLAWASFMEWRGEKKKGRHRERRAPDAATINTGDAMQRPF